MVKWIDTKTVEVKDRLKSITVDGSELLEQMEGATFKEKETAFTFVPKDHSDVYVDFNVGHLISPLGDLGRMLFMERRMDVIRPMVERYWSLKGKPKASFDVLKVDTETGKDCITLRSKVGKEGLVESRLGKLLETIDEKVISERLDRLVIGGDGSHVEMQFLGTEMRKESGAEKGDLLDPGIFVRFNGNVKVAAGVHRLICTNGLTDTLHTWERDTMEFLRNKEVIDRSLTLMDWMTKQVGKKVGSVREISVALSKHYPEAFLNRFYKHWSERCELKDLDWYAVIDDLTRAVNNTLGEIRYKALEVGQRIKKVEMDCHCPTCSASI